MTFPAYEPAGAKCSGVAQPGVVAFMRWAVEDYGREASNLGIYNCRTVRGSTVRSVHGEGRAGDVGFPGVAAQAGTDLLNLLLPHVGELGIQLIIWNRRSWSAKKPTSAVYRGVSPHTDHLHIEFTWNAARTLTQDRVRVIVGGRPASKPLTPIVEDDMYIRDNSSGTIYALSATHYQALTAEQWADRVAEGARVFNMHPLEVVARIKSRVRVG